MPRLAFTTTDLFKCHWPALHKVDHDIERGQIRNSKNIYWEIMINHHQNSFYSFSVNTYKEIIISLNSLYARDLGGTSVEDEIPERGL